MPNQRVEGGPASGSGPIAELAPSDCDEGSMEEEGGAQTPFIILDGVYRAPSVYSSNCLSKVLCGRANAPDFLEGRVVHF